LGHQRASLFGMKNQNKFASKAAALARTGLRIAVVLAFAYLVLAALDWLQTNAAETGSASDRWLLNGAVLLMFAAYVLLMAVPFVPGIEIGLSLLMMQGPSIAPAVYLATVTGLTLAYLVGRYMPYRMLHGLFSDIGLKSASGLLERLHPLSRLDRVALLEQNLPKWLRKPLLEYRHLSVALAVNIPGNAFIGGGGGIAMLAGLSGLFTTRSIVITFLLAVSPFPLLVWTFGEDMLTLIK